MTDKPDVRIVQVLPLPPQPETITTTTNDAQPTPEIDKIARRHDGQILTHNEAIAQYNDLLDKAREIESDRNRLRAQLAGVVEQCAKVCDEIKKEQLRRPVADWNNGPDIAEECADEIRSLAPEAKGEQPGAGEDAWKIDGYEYLRKLTPNDFKRLWERNLAGENFDDMIRDSARGVAKERK